MVDKKMSRFTPCALAFFLLVTSWAGLRHVSAQDVVITLEQKDEETISLGYTDIKVIRGDASSVPFSTGDVIRNDLEFSGRFVLFHSSEYDAAAKKYFEENGALGYVRGTLAFEGDNFLLDAHLVDVSTDEVIVGKKLSGKKSDLRNSAHAFSDELVFQLFGEKGIAQTRIAYVSSRSGNKEIYAMDYDGANFVQLTKNGSINLNPCWMDENSKIVFTSYAGGNPGFQLLNVTTRVASPYSSPAGMSTAPAYNKIDRELVFANSSKGATEIFRAPAAGGKPSRLTFTGGINTSPTWSPNGYEIAFMSDRNGNPMLYVMDRDGSNVRRITFEGKYHGSPAWSPKGDLIAFSSMEGSNMDIYTITPDGKNLRRLTSRAGSNESPSWSPDGRHIAFTSTRTGSSEIFVMRGDGSHPKRLSFSGGNSMPKWSD